MKEPVKEPAPRLVRFKLDHPVLAGGPNMSSAIECARPPGQLDGWSLSIRGPAVFLISPPGWNIAGASGSRAGFDATGPRRVFEIPRVDVTFEWEMVDPTQISKLTSIDVPPFERAAPPRDEVAIDPKEVGDP